MVTTYIRTAQNNEPAKGAMEKNAWISADEGKYIKSERKYEYYVYAGTA